MRKILGLAVAFAAVAAGADAARASYVVAPTAYAFQDISGTGDRFLDDVDDQFASFDLGSPFNFYGTDYGTIFISLNGLITFDSGTNQFFNEDLSGFTFNMRPSIAAFWDDLQTKQVGTDAVYAQNFADRTVVQWNNVGGYNPDGYDGLEPNFATFQAVLFNTGEIAFHYQDVTFGDFRDGGGSATIGVRNPDGQFAQWSVNAAAVTGESSLLFSSPDPTPNAVPLPGGLLLVLLGAGSCGIGGLARRRAAARIPNCVTRPNMRRANAI